MQLNEFVKERRKQANLTQPELALKAGVGLRFLRDLDQGKQTLRLDKVNQVLRLFGHQVGPIPIPRHMLV
ncbi:helix-turn-helix domain-containing protein [Pontibacter burrus]|uniref:Helix-turn-helix transcriptional regulator n=1 Tax=Pontibacter burrus TaxID=2704466 RepID=A0A6B3LUN8_9BACT|nr:helix-turn-helix domain-containing protein [Pontibacter burrus]NEM97214.1 helix-turn-helix transcriptional regulator [Pontibacter burrus]